MNIILIIMEIVSNLYIRKLTGAPQQITKQSSTHVMSYLVDKKTGLEIQDASIHPHQRVDFVQSMELISSRNGFIAYYHIPKEGHKIEYLNENDVYITIGSIYGRMDKQTARHTVKQKLKSGKWQLIQEKQ